MPTVHTNGINLYYESSGAGEPLLLIAGVGQDHNAWAFLAPSLAAQFQLILPDNRGAGQTEMPDIAYTVEMMAADMIGLLDALGIAWAHVAGHSLGAAIAFEMGRACPERVGKVVMMSALYPGPQVVMPSERAMPVLTDRSGDPEELVKRGIRIAAAPDFEARQPALFDLLLQAGLRRTQPANIYLRQSAAGGMYLGADHLAGGFAPPLLLLYGEHDEVAPAENGRRIQAALPGAQLRLIPEAGHLLHVEQPAAVAVAMGEFLRG